jgi:hypothetical protein
VSARLALAALAVALGFAALAALLMPNPAPRAPRPAPEPAPAAVLHITAPTAHAVTAVPAADAGSTIPTADEAFLADLTDGQAVDLDPQQAADLVATAHRMCDLGQPRADWLASLTVPGPHALTDGEATHLYDSAIAGYCPQRFDPAALAPNTPAATPATTTHRTSTTATHRTSTRPAPVATPATTAAPAAPSTAEAPAPTVDATPAATPSSTEQQQLPEEQIGGARCGDTDQVVVAITADGLPACG